LLLNINGAVQRGILVFNIGSRLTDDLAHKFQTHFQSALIDVIDQAALKAESGGLCTLSDLKEAYLIANEKSKDPIFFLPPGEGGAESYLNNIVPQLKDRKIILFNNLYLEGGLKNDNVQNYYTFETLAAQYIRYIKKIQPVGPYELFGWSFGGVLAFEIARQLEKNGDQISKIILIDPYFNYKKVIEALCQDFPKFQTRKLQDNINYKHQCNNDKYRTNAEIVLFKFSKIDKIKSKYLAKHEDEVLLNQDIGRIASYYNKTINNHIKDYVSCNNMKIIPLTSTHAKWKENIEDLSLVVKSIYSNSIP
ncbi:MAG: hypothetical protein KAH18_12950, partial [Psychromonas sp.]|nr:hypothetical protein [Psychromonas sp.]